MSYAIEDGIPIPAPRRGGGPPPRGPRTALTQAINKLEPGQSFLMTDPCEYRRTCGYVHCLPDRKFRTRKTREGWRVWRLE